ncbi:hypothetical protein [Luteolibacter luteus]|uniref:Uncharacterized protein n=1 Tax=Luteolibacter luteus TaxID=2728835 RepID=A0A858RG94_9BACT|nr:hypothetical protein [Luteolibacter luteus]QJE95857.1 hypothetical protein HHL09_08685 [Luteolibacter luteus]
MILCAVLLPLGFSFFRGERPNADVTQQQKPKPVKQERLNDEAKELQESIERSKQSALEQLEALTNAPSPPSFRLLVGGSLSPDAAFHTNLSEEEKAKVNTVVSRMWEEASAELRQRARYDADSSDPAERRWVYRIRASRDRGNSLRENLTRDLTDIVGEERQQLLTSKQDWGDPLGNFGRYDVHLEYDEKTSTWKCEYFNPDNGRTASYGQPDQLNFEIQFGTGFLEEMEKKRTKD